MGLVDRDDGEATLLGHRSAIMDRARSVKPDTSGPCIWIRWVLWIARTVGSAGSCCIDNSYQNEGLGLGWLPVGHPNGSADRNTRDNGNNGGTMGKVVVSVVEKVRSG